MAKPVPADEVSSQPVEGSREELKEQEVQEDKHAQQIANRVAEQKPDITLPAKS